MSNRRQTVKTVARYLVGMSVGSVASQVIFNNLEPQAKRTKRVEQAVGTFVIGSIAAEHGRRYTDRVVDQVFDLFEGTKTEETPTTSE